jgi:L-rhamnose mutarotase
MIGTMKKSFFFLLISLLALTGCKQNSGRNEISYVIAPATVKKPGTRYGMVTGVKPEKVEYYKQLHAKPWPSVLAKIKECNIENYSIYLQKIEDKYYLFSYFEYTGQDFDADMRKMAADTATRRWWQETDPCQLPLSEALTKHKIWTNLQEVFHMN